MTETKVIQKMELSKEKINSVIDKAIKELYETTTTSKDCDLNYKILKIEDNKVHVKFSWIKEFINYDSSCNSWDEVYNSYNSIYDFSKEKDILLDEILEELEDNVIVNF